MDQPLKLLNKIFEAKKKFRKIKKTETNPHFKSKYADLEEYLDAIESDLADQKVMIYACLIGNSVVSRIVDLDSGEYLESIDDIQRDQSPHQRGSAITYSRRYAIKCLLNLVDVDDDGNAASPVPANSKMQTLDPNRKPHKETPIGFEATKEHQNIYWNSTNGRNQFKSIYNVEIFKDEKLTNGKYVYAPLGTYDLVKAGGTPDLTRKDAEDFVF